MRQAVAEA